MKLALLSWCLAPLALASTGCDLVLDIDRLDRGADTGPPGIEVVASGQCHPGRVTIADGFVYWTTTRDMNDGSPCFDSTSNAIRRLALDTTGTPTNVVTTDLDGKSQGTRPWDLRVIGGDVFWIGYEGTLCTAKTDGVNQACTPFTKAGKTCNSQGLAGTGADLVFSGGVCSDTTTQIERYETTTQMLVPTGLSVSDDFVSAIATTSTWFAWIDPAGTACTQRKEDQGNNRLNVAWPGTANWASCSNKSTASAVHDVVVDDARLYWLDTELDGTASLYALALSPQLTKTDKATKLVSGLGDARSLAIDEHNVYFTTVDRGGAVLYVPKDATSTRNASEASVLAEKRGELYGINATPGLPWIYWLEIGTAGSVVRAPKPAP